MSYKPKSSKGLKGGPGYKPSYMTGAHNQSEPVRINPDVKGGGVKTARTPHDGKVGLKRG